MDSNKTIIEQAKDSIKNLPEFIKTKKGKKALIITVVVLLVIAILGTSVGLLSNSKTGGYSELLLMIMPEEVTDESTGRTYYIEKNENYDPDSEAPLDAFTYYYFDADGNRVEVPNGTYTDENGTVTQVALGFLLSAGQTIKTIKTVLSYVLAVVIIAVIAGSIYIAYRIWLKKELENDAKMAKANQGKKR